MKIFIASDHTGYDMKQYLLERFGYGMVDLGTSSREPCDYPILAQKLCNEVLIAKNCCGILICFTGNGVAIVANRYRKIRAAICFNEKMAELSRRHNDANIIVFGAAVITPEMAWSCLCIFLETKFEDGGRHERRLQLIDGGVT
ncbi:MAG: RpiB/LacA/LacB family sugar-phosphate isomerase [Holosporaceae bacterium]|jgi:ribose 5-phosphate isomerase B|nr:RpiB/LacA/LacB family sugar-phosphate isomerase [Holosporaceae bacterium]